MNEIFENRINRLRTVFKEPNEAALITNEVNIGYFSGFFHSEGYLLITQNSAVLLVDFRYFEAAQKKACCEVKCFDKLSETLAELLQKESVGIVHIEAQSVTVSRFDFFKKLFEKHNAEICADGRLDAQISKCRKIKSQTELDKIQTAQNIAEKAYLELLNDVKPGASERMLAARLQYLMKLYGAEEVSFDLITITGKKTSLPHGVPDDSVICHGDFFTCDFGAVYEGYHSDTTRTVAVGNATDEMRMIYGVVLQAQLKALEEVKPGATCADIDKAARDLITEAGFGEYFGHSTGHGVGLDIHELPAVSVRSSEKLEPGMVITDEPGIYLPGKFGVRIEDMLCVTENGCLNFVSLDKQLIVI